MSAEYNMGGGFFTSLNVHLNGFSARKRHGQDGETFADIFIKIHPIVWGVSKFRQLTGEISF